MRRVALLSVYDKTGIVAFARRLRRLGFDILASAGTAATLSNARVRVQDVADLVGEPILDHRIVTLSRKTRHGVLARGQNIPELERLGIPWVALVCVDLYPLAAEIARAGNTRESVIERTDVGGLILLHSAAIGQRIVICDQADRQRVLDWLEDGCPEEEAFISGLVGKAEGLVAAYCLDSARYHSGGSVDGMIGTQVEELPYGENRWQGPAQLFSTGSFDPLAAERFALVAGAAPGFINRADLDRVTQTITHIAAAWDTNRGQVPLIAVAAKHGNSCGAAVGNYSVDVLQRMVTGDRRAIFGGVVMTNFPIRQQEANALLHYAEEAPRRLLDVIAAPRFTKKALQMLQRRGGRCRLLANPALGGLSTRLLDLSHRFRPVRGGFLAQPNYRFVFRLDHPQLEKSSPVASSQEDDLLLAWAIGSTSNSNTITLVRDTQLIGNGVGQQDRVGAAALAVTRAREAGHDTAGAVAYSDSFFPFTDGPGVLADAGVAVILATSGSIRDSDIRQFCEERGVPLWRIPDEVGRGFCWH